MNFKSSEICKFEPHTGREVSEMGFASVRLSEFHLFLFTDWPTVHGGVNHGGHRV